MKNLILLFLLSSLLQLNAQTNRTIKFHETQITIDGKIDEAIWQKLPAHTNFFNHFPLDSGQAKNQTAVKIFHNGKNLYLSAVYFDSTPKTQLSSLKRDDVRNSVAFSDAFVFVIDTYNQQQNGYYFAVNIGGTQTDALIEQRDDGSFNINNSWNAVWKANASSNGNQKFFEMEIPLKALGFDANNPVFGIQFYTRDIKTTEWTCFTEIKRNFAPYDLRFTQAFNVEQLAQKKISRFSATPSITINSQKNVANNNTSTTFKPSLDIQYNISSALKLDVTINPDFSQIDVDRQVTNLTRFAINFPERRNFFLENSDLFSNLGVKGVNPFYSRRIGATSNIQYGLKLSGNVATNTRLGILDVQTQNNENTVNQNYGIVVLQQKLNNVFSATGFLINRQENDGLKFLNDYNRVSGINLNYKSKNNKWTALGNFGKSFTDEHSDKNNFYHTGIWYSTRAKKLEASIKKLGKNYLTDIGFVPRLYNYDAENAELIREGYTHLSTGIRLTAYPKNSTIIDSYQYLNLLNNAYWDESGTLVQLKTVFFQTLWFKNISSVYFNVYNDYINLKYGFDPLQNGNFIQPNTYNFTAVQLGYNSVFNKKLSYNFGIRYGQYYHGRRTRMIASLGHRMLPFAKLKITYELNKIDLKELGEKTFHLARFTGEVFFSKKLNWTTYLQYNTQRNNFNINSRLQWEYKPLSYIYLVVSDNFNEELQQGNWGIAFKMNYRFDF